MYFPEWGGGGGKCPYMGNLEAGPRLGYPWSPCSSNRQTKHGPCLIGCRKTPGARTGNLPYLEEAGPNTLDLVSNKPKHLTTRKWKMFHQHNHRSSSWVGSFQSKKNCEPSECQLVAEQVTPLSFFGGGDKSKYVDG